MSAARSAPSGPAVSPEGATPTQGRIATTTIASAGNPVDCCAVAVPAPGGSYLVDAASQANSGSATTTARYQVIFTPTRTGVAVVKMQRSLSVGTTPEPFRLQPLFVKVEEAGELKIQIGNTGAQSLTATGVDAQIQPVTITT